MNTKTSFHLAEAPNGDGSLVPAYGFEWNDTFIVDARRSECGRFEISPEHYRLTDAQADELTKLNAGRDLL